MNIFYLDQDVTLCAQAHTDQHVVKMTLETAQILCAALWLSGQSALYKLSHQKHPCVVWATESLDNWRWLKTLGTELNKEFVFRFNKTNNHKSFDVIQILPTPNIPEIGITTRPLAMPEQYRNDDPVIAYRNYYLGEKAYLFRWTKRHPPEWILNSGADIILK